MKVVKGLMRGAMALAIAASVAAPASATTLVRASLDDLVAANGAVVLGEVVDVESYWNAEGNFILTDVRFAVSDVLKGNASRGSELTVTLMGGRVGDITTLIIGGPQLIPGKSYMVFLNEESLPGVQALTVRDLVQGTFDVVMAKDGLRAVSQANSHPLIPDKQGYMDAPGGVEGFPLKAMMNSIREIAARPAAAQREMN